MSKSNQNLNSGVLLVNKPIGPTSHDIVALLRRQLRQLQTSPSKIKIGHTGTLDPFASGLLVIAFGSATRLIEYTSPWSKTYLLTVHLDAHSDTDDPTGQITHLDKQTTTTSSAIQAALKKFTGTINQTPPIYSAKKISGQRLYQLARASTDADNLAQLADSKTTTITIHQIKLVSYKYPLIKLEVTCSRGTYLRSLARDLGTELKTSAYATELTRTKIGKFDINQALNPNIYESENLFIDALPAATLVHHLPNITLSNDNVAQLRMGKLVEWGNELAGETSQNPTTLAVFNQQKELVSIVELDNTTSLLHPQKNLI